VLCIKNAPGGPKATRRAVPFEGSSSACCCNGRVAPSAAPSREGPLLLGVCVRPDHGAIGSPLLPRPRRFRRVQQCLSVRRPPALLGAGFILPRAPRLLQSVYSLRPAPRVPGEPCDLPVDRRAPPMGSLPSSRHQPAASTAARGTTPGLTFRPRRFSRPRRLPPPPALRVCFTPQPRPGFALQGFVPLRGAVPAYTGRFMPSCR